MGDHRRGKLEAPSIAWVTNVGAPYRHPVWSALAERSQLAVGLLADNEPNRQWDADLPAGVRRLPTRAWGLHRGELHLYLLATPVLRGHHDAVVLPGWETPAAWQLLIEAKLRRIRTVAFYESSTGSHRFSTGPVAWMRRLYFRSADVVVTVGAASRSAVLDFGVRADRVVGTSNTVDVKRFRSSERDGAKRPADTFVYVGQLIHRKNVQALIAAMAHLPESARLIVAGEGPEEGALRRQVAALALDDRVELRGYVPYADVPRLLHEASTLVLPSSSEVYGLVVIEALAAGSHVVVTECSGVFADVRDLVGVFPASPVAASLGAAMAASAAAWSGPTEQPAILARTPLAMAQDVLRACTASLG